MPLFRTNHVPLYALLGDIAALWTITSVGYYFLLPVFGFSLSYNAAPVVISGYYIFWAVVSVMVFWNFFEDWIEFEHRVWIYAALSLGFAGAVWGGLYTLAHLPAVYNTSFRAAADILTATPWYFLPKAVEILVQQVLVAALVLALWAHFRSFHEVRLGYAIIFGGAHVALFMLNSAPTAYAALMTIGAICSTFIFPYLILRVKSGFIYAYMIHFMFYVTLALALRLI